VACFLQPTTDARLVASVLLTEVEREKVLFSWDYDGSDDDDSRNQRYEQPKVIHPG
jgi:hypothetical protein